MVYNGKEFQEYFADFIARFGITDLYTSSFYPYPSEEVRWAYWAKRYEKADNYEAFISHYANRCIVFLELGVGFNTPTIIRYPFEQMTYRNPQAVLIRLNKDYPNGITENRHRTLSFGEDIEKVMKDLEKK